MATKISAKDRQATINHLISKDQDIYVELQNLKQDIMRNSADPVMRQVAERLQKLCNDLSEHLERNKEALLWAV